jgi:hypothetical protein
MNKALPLTLLCIAFAGCGPGKDDKGGAPGTASNAQTEVPAKATVAGLPLLAGHYVASHVPCEQATADTVFLVTGKGRRSALEACAFESIVPGNEGTFKVVERCEDLASGSKSAPTTLGYQLQDETAFLAKDGVGWELEARHCPQQSLPEPWRSEAIG